MLDVNGWELIALIVVGILVLGPERLPEYAGKLANMVRQVRNLATNARTQLKDQMGPEFEDVDWRQFDPRQYDPRRIVKEALLDPLDEAIAPVRSELDSVRTAASTRNGASTRGAAVAAGAVGTASAAGDGAASPDDDGAWVVPDRRTWDPARPTPFDPDAT